MSLWFYIFDCTHCWTLPFLCIFLKYEDQLQNHIHDLTDGLVVRAFSDAATEIPPKTSQNQTKP